MAWAARGNSGAELGAVGQAVAMELGLLGVARGDRLLVHSSFRALTARTTRLSNSEFGVQLWLGFLQAIGPEGTLLVPALSHEYFGQHNPVFDERLTRSCVGYLSEAFRRHLAQARSLDPAYSVCARGSDVDYFLAGHLDCLTPFGPDSPFARFLAAERSGTHWIAFLGCSCTANTCLHAVEDALGLPYLYGETCEAAIIDRFGQVHSKQCFLPGFADRAQRYDRIVPKLPQSAVLRGELLGAELVLLEASQLRQTALQVLRKNPEFLVEPLP